MNTTNTIWKNQWLRLFAYLLAILGMTVSASFFPVWGNAVFAVIAPLVVLITVPMVRFERVKLTTLLVGRTLTLLTALYLFPDTWLLIIVAVLMYLNVAEAVLSDARKRRWANVLAGVAVLATTHLLFDAIWVAHSTSGTVVNIGYYVMTHPGMLYWVIAYTIWNFNFVIGEFSPAISLYHIAILATPAIVSALFGSVGIWVLARATSLTSGGTLQIVRKASLESDLKSERFERAIKSMRGTSFQVAIAVLVLAFSVLSLLVES